MFSILRLLSVAAACSLQVLTQTRVQLHSLFILQKKDRKAGITKSLQRQNSENTLIRSLAQRSVLEAI